MSIGSIFVDFVARTTMLKEGTAEAVATVQKAGADMAQANTVAAQSNDKLVQSFERGFLRVAIGAHVYGLIRHEIQDVVRNIDNIPGISESTLESVHRLKYAFEEANGGLKGYIATAAGWLVTGVQGVTVGIASMFYGIAAAKEGWKLLNEAAEIFAEKEFNKKLELLQEKLADMALTTGQLAQKLKEAANAKITFSNSGSDTPQERWDAEIQAMEMMISAKEKMNAIGAEYARTAAAESAAQERAKIDIMGGAAAVAFLTEKMHLLEEEKRAITKGQIWGPFRSGIDPKRAEEFNIKLKEITATTAELERATNRALRPYMQMVTIVGDDLTNAFVGAFGGAGDAFKKLGQSIKMEIEKIVVQLLIVQPLFGMLGGMFGAGPGVMGSIGTAFTKYSGGRASGGDIKTGHFAMVGENGPELFAQPGTIISQDKIAASLGGGNNGGGGGNVYQIDARGADTTAVARLEATIIALNGSIERRSVAANIAASRRGGNLGRGLAA